MASDQAASIVYPIDFVVRLKEAYPNAERLHDMLDVNSALVGRWLDAVVYNNSISAEEVVSAMNGGLDAMVKLRETAERGLKGKWFYHEWYEITQGD